MGDCSWGFCTSHYSELLRRAANKNDRPEIFERMIHPPIPHWEYENEQGEKELAELVEQQERDKAREN